MTSPRPRSIPQNRKFSAIVGEVAAQCPLIPYRRAFQVEAWRLYFIALYVRGARLSAFHEGAPDPFPVRPVPSSQLDAQQMSDLIECAQAYCAENNLVLRK
jgi:hypothetical protein